MNLSEPLCSHLPKGQAPAAPFAGAAGAGAHTPFPPGCFRPGVPHAGGTNYKRGRLLSGSDQDQTDQIDQDVVKTRGLLHLLWLCMGIHNKS